MQFYALHNINLIDYSDKTLDISTTDKEAFFGREGNIKPYGIIPQTQTAPINYICYNLLYPVANRNSFKITFLLNLSHFTTI